MHLCAPWNLSPEGHWIPVSKPSQPTCRPKHSVASTSSYVLRLNSAMVDHDISTFRGTRTQNGPFVRIRETSKALPEVFLGRRSKSLIFVESPARWTLGSIFRAIEDHPSSQARWSRLFPQVDIDVDSDRPCRQLRGLPNSRGHTFFEILEVSKCGASSLLWATLCAHLSQD
jgi:hypothetical protein